MPSLQRAGPLSLPNRLELCLGGCEQPFGVVQVVRGPVLSGQEAGGGNHPESDIPGRHFIVLCDRKEGRYYLPCGGPVELVCREPHFALVEEAE